MIFTERKAEDLDDYSSIMCKIWASIRFFKLKLIQRNEVKNEKEIGEA